jgi:hypothetical protein
MEPLDDAVDHDAATLLVALAPRKARSDMSERVLNGVVADLVEAQHQELLGVVWS